MRPRGAEQSTTGWFPRWDAVSAVAGQLYNALPAREAVIAGADAVTAGTAQALSASKQVLVETAQTFTTPEVFTNTAAAVSDVVNAGVARTHRELKRHYPELHENLNARAGYQEALLKPQTAEYLRYLIEDCKVDPNHNDQGYNALSAISQGGPDQDKRIQFLLSHRIDINSQAVKACHRTPLQLMITHGSEESVLFLIHRARNRRRVIDFKVQDDHGNTALLLAIKMMSPEIALCIIEQSCHGVDIGLDKVDSKGRSALECAFVLGQSEVFNVLSKMPTQSAFIETVISDAKNSSSCFIRSLLREIYEPNSEEYKTYGVIDIELQERIDQLESQCLKKQALIRGIFSPAPPQSKPSRYTLRR